MSKAHELRFGKNGSLSVDLKKGTWHDHEAKEGGGVLDLVARCNGKRGAEAIRWLEEQGFNIDDGRPRDQRPQSKSAGKTSVAKLEERPAAKPVPLRDDDIPASVPAGSKLVAKYDYEDDQGRLVFQVVRFEHRKGAVVEKTFRQRRPGERPGTWIWSVKDVEQVPYRLPELGERVGEGLIVFLTEGEKDVENLIALGATATCNAMGAGKWPDELNKHFVGARVVILPDNDAAGRKHRDLVARALVEVAASVSVLELPGLPEKGDVSDWIASGGTVQDLYDLANDKAWSWSEAASYESRFHAVRWRDLDRPGPEHEWLVKGLLTRGERSMVAGPSQSGKSFFVLDLALAVARGIDFKAYARIGGAAFQERAFKTMRGGVIYQAGEGGRGIKKRLRAYREHHKIEAGDHLPFVLLPSPVDLHANDDNTNALIAEVRHWATTFDCPLELIVIDTLSAATPGANENASEDMSRVLARCERLAQATGAHVMLVHHMNADGSKPRGHTSIFANLDNAMTVRKVEGLREPPREITLADGSKQTIAGREVREAILTKQKDGEDGTEIRFVLRYVGLGIDADGDRISSCVVGEPQLDPNAIDPRAMKGRAVNISDDAMVFVRALQRAIEDFGKPAPVSLGLPKSVRVVEFSRVFDAFASMTAEADSETDETKKKEVIAKAIKRHGSMLMSRSIIGRQTPYIWMVDRPVRGLRPSSSAAPSAASAEPDAPSADAKGGAQ